MADLPEAAVPLRSRRLSGVVRQQEMEISSSAATGIMRVGLQVVSNHTKPHLEFYYEVRNRFDPEQEFETPAGASGIETRTHKIRFQDIFIQFSVINIGGIRAENIEFEISGDLTRNKPREDLGELLDTEFPQLAPGQQIHLFRFDHSDLNLYPEDGGKRLGLKRQELHIVATYNAPPSIMNWLISLPMRIRGKKQYETTFIFKASMVSGDLPPAEYA